MAYYRARRHSSVQSSAFRPFVAFLLVASFGILFAGCGGAEPSEIPSNESFTFTADDLARMKELMGQQPMIGGGGSGSEVPFLVPLEDETTSAAEQIPVLDVRTQAQYAAVRSGGDAGQDMYRVTNAFLNIRSAPRVTAEQTGRLEQGDPVDVIEFTDAAWAKVRMGDAEGYVSSRYISKVVSEEQLAADKKKYEGLYFVDFGFLNVRKSPDGDSDKIGELPAQAFVRPLSMDDVWARIPFGDSYGYVAVQYLTPFVPNFLVRQDAFSLPVVHYRLAEPEVLDRLPQHIAKLQQEGYSFLTVRRFAELLLEQQERDVRIPPKSVIIAVSDVTSETMKEVSDILRVSGIPATLFLRTEEVGGSISQQNIQTLLANGMDLQSAGHTGDDLRSLTNSQVELELSQSRALLEEATGRDVYAIAYPVGGVNERVAAKAAEAGYLLGISSASGTQFKRQDLLQLPSFVVRTSTTAEEVLAAVQGQ